MPAIHAITKKNIHFRCCGMLDHFDTFWFRTCTIFFSFIKYKWNEKKRNSKNPLLTDWINIKCTSCVNSIIFIHKGLCYELNEKWNHIMKFREKGINKFIVWRYLKINLSLNLNTGRSTSPKYTFSFKKVMKKSISNALCYAFMITSVCIYFVKY